MARLFPEPPPERAHATEGDWVLVHQVILPAGERARSVPSETAAVPLEMRVKGFLVGGPGEVGAEVTARTLSGRLVAGALAAVEPVIPPTFGSPVPELLRVGPELRARLRKPSQSRPHQ